MKHISKKIDFSVFDSKEELEPKILNLMNQAILARKTAYAPYSEFLVGTALLLENGKIVIGSNQENAAYPSGLCAERVAFFSAGAQYPNVKIKSVAITATPKDRLNTIPIPPCGACRQSMMEYEQRQNESIPVYFMGAKGEVYLSNSLENLLPFVFESKFLK